jgi:hypothetical protein
MRSRTLMAGAIALALFAGGATASAQDINTAIEFLRTDIAAKKKQFVAKAMDLTEKEADVFWPIYRDFETDFAKIGSERIALVKDYAANYAAMTEPKATELVKKLFATEQKRLDLKEKYFKIMSKKLSARVAARFVQTETYFTRLLDTTVSGEVPLMPKPEEIMK